MYQPPLHPPLNLPEPLPHTHTHAERTTTNRVIPAVSHAGCGQSYISVDRQVQQFFFFFLSFYLFWGPHQWACRILAPQSGIEPALPAVEAQNFNPWPASEVPSNLFFFFFFIIKMLSILACN